MGRQRGVLLGSILVVLSCLAVAQASLMAIDLGSENLKVSLIKPGRTPIAVVVNEMSKRKTPALVGFANGERLIGEEAASFLVRYPESIVMRARDLLGKPHNDSSVLTMLRDHNLPYKVVEHPTRKQAAVQVKEGVFVSAEELVGSTLQYARQIAEAQSGAPVLDAVIAVPAYFGQAQRQALIDAANLVGINVMGLINTHTAAALQFGIERDFTNKTENVIFYDMGAGGTVATLVRYSSYASKEAGPGKAVSQLEIRDVDWDSDLGANSLDTLLSEHFAKGFSTKSKIPLEEIMGNPRTMAKLKKQVRRTKEMLSANSAAPISVEELHDGRDFQSSITREEFETLAGGFFEQAAQPLKRILERSGLKIEELDYVELLGGGTRVPRLQAALTEALNGRILDRHVDADEAVVLGASLFAANLSTSFRLRKFGMADLSMYGVTLRIDEAHEPAVLPDATEPPKDQSAERNLLPYLKKLPAKRVVHFTNLTKDPIRVSLHYNASTPHPLPPGATEPELARFNITGIDTVIKRYNSSGTVNLRFEAAHDGILRLTRAEAVVEYVVMEEKLVPIKPPSTVNATTTEETNTTSTSAEGKDDASPPGAEPGETESPDGDIEDAPPAPSEGGEEAAEAAEGEGADVPPKASEEEEEEVKTKEGKTGEAKSESVPPSPEPETMNATEPPAPKYETIIVSRKKVAKVTLNVSSSYTVEPLDGDDLKAAEAALAGWVAAELTKRQTAAAKNDLEAYIIKMRDAVENDEKILQVTIADQRTPFLASLAEAEDWLYMDGEGEEAAAFKERLAALRKVGNAMESRAQEFEARPQVMSAARKEAELKLAAVGLWEDSRPWITAEERKAIEEKLKTFLKSLDDKEALQAAKAVHEDPAFTAREVAVEYEKLEKAFNRIANKRKPKPPPEPPAPVNATANGTAAGNATEAGSAPSTGGDSPSTCVPEGDGSNCAAPKADAETEQPSGTPPDPKAEKAKKDAAEKAKKEAAEKAKKDAEKAKKDAADKAKKDKEAKAKAKKEKEEKAKKDKEAKAKKEAADKAKKEKEAKAKGTGKPKATDPGKAKTGGKGDKNAEL